MLRFHFEQPSFLEVQVVRIWIHNIYHGLQQIKLKMHHTLFLGNKKEASANAPQVLDQLVMSSVDTITSMGYKNDMHHNQIFSFEHPKEAS